MHSIQYDTVNKLPRIDIPVLVIHSRMDNLIGFHHAEKNFEAAREPKMFLETGGHHTNVLDVDRDRYLTGLEQFLARHFRSELKAES